MIHFRDLRIKTKLYLVFIILLLPVLLGQGLTILDLRQDLRESAGLELDNIVRALYRACELQAESRGDASLTDEGGSRTPTPEAKAYLDEVFASFKVGNSGYPYVMDPKGNLLIHPVKKGQNIYQSRDTKGVAFIEEICRRAVKLAPDDIGMIRYPWMNAEEGERAPRMKILKFKYFPRWQWIVAVGAYEEEVYAVYDRIEWYWIILALLSLILVFGLTLALNRLITRPLKAMSEAAEQLAGGDLSREVRVQSNRDAFARLANSFNSMTRQIREKTENLESKVQSRTKDLNESRELYRSLVESTTDGIVTTDISGRITFANSGMEKMVKSRREAMLGRKIWEFYEGGIEQARYIMKHLRQDGVLTNYELIIHAPEMDIPIMISASLLMDSHMQERGTLGIFRDVTTLKKLESDLQKAQADLVQTMKLRALGDLVAGVAHEINNPLMASTTMLHVISKQLGDESKLHKKLDVMARCNERIAGIVNHLREFSRQETLEMKPIQMAKPLENALLITTQQMLNMQVVIEKDFAEGLPLIMGDAGHLEQIFLDIIANARDALTEVDRRMLRVGTQMDELNGRPAVAALISDSGPGIAPDIAEKIFEPFFTTKKVGQGTGLGLSISYGIIEEHGGHIELDSRPGDGATFKILIPVLSNGEVDTGTEGKKS